VTSKILEDLTVISLVVAKVRRLSVSKQIAHEFGIERLNYKKAK